MPSSGNNIEFVGERFVPGSTDRRIEADHLERYRFASSLVKNMSVLDIACGTGYAASLLMAAGARRYRGIDISVSSVEYAQQNYRAENVTFATGDICDITSEDKYDVIVSFETIEHVRQYRLALANLYSLLSMNGTLVISSPNRLITSPRAASIDDRPSNKFHTQEFTPSELTNELIEAGFYVGRTEIYGQRQRYRNRVIWSLLRRVTSFDPFASITSPKVTPVHRLTPRYFVLIARKFDGSK